jgi:hypothetical protein
MWENLPPSCVLKIGCTRMKVYGVHLSGLHNARLLDLSPRKHLKVAETTGIASVVEELPEYHLAGLHQA